MAKKVWDDARYRKDFLSAFGEGTRVAAEYGRMLGEARGASRDDAVRMVEDSADEIAALQAMGLRVHPYDPDADPGPDAPEPEPEAEPESVIELPDPDAWRRVYDNEPGA